MNKIENALWWLSLAAFVLTSAIYAWQERFVAAAAGLTLSVSTAAHRFLLHPRLLSSLAKRATAGGVCLAGWLAAGLFGSGFVVGAGLLTLTTGWQGLAWVAGKLQAALRRRSRVGGAAGGYVIDCSTNADHACAIEMKSEMKGAVTTTTTAAAEPQQTVPIPSPILSVSTPPPKYAFKTVTVN